MCCYFSRKYGSEKTKIGNIPTCQEAFFKTQANITEGPRPQLSNNKGLGLLEMTEAPEVPFLYSFLNHPAKPFQS